MRSKNFKTEVQWYHRLKTIIYTHVQKEHYVFDGAVEVNESYFGGIGKGKRLPVVGRIS